MILVDSSVWVLSARSPGFALPADIRLDQLVTCAPVLQEVLQGAVDERSFRAARASMMALRMIDDPLTHERNVQAATIYRTGRAQGYTVRSAIDCLIAAIAITYGVPLLHSDRDFLMIARFTTLESRYIPQ